MKIGVDISQSVYEGTGSARFTHGLIQSIIDYSQEDWTFFFSALRRQIDPNVKKNILDKGYQLKQYPFPPKVLDYLWNRLHIMPVDQLIGQQDWFITSDWTQPPGKSKIATIVHDMIFKIHPETVDPFLISVQQKRIEWAVKESNLFLALSESTKKDLVQCFNVDEKRIVVNYPGVDVHEPTKEHLLAIKKKYNLSKPFILSVGKREPRKNLKRLIEAFSNLQTEDMELLIVGPQGWDEIESKSKNVRLLGYVPDKDLFELYKTALFFVFPSLYEGFGYPAVEAMKLGCPVAMSNTSSLQEIGENSALMFNPLEVDDIQASLKKMIEDKSLRQDLIKKGTKKSAEFTWERYYKTLMIALSI